MLVDVEVAVLLAAVLVAKVAGVFSPDDASVLNAFLNVVGVLGVAIVGYLQAKVLQDNARGRREQNRRVSDDPERRNRRATDPKPEPEDDQ